MKPKAIITTVGGLAGFASAFLFAGLAFGQIQFERVTNGPHVTDVHTSFGASWGDYDNDGWVDLLVVNGFGQNNCLYRNNGDGTFTKVTEGPIPNDGGDGSGAIWADFDNDGDLDLYVSNFDPSDDFLYRNDGDGNFVQLLEGDVPNDGVRTAAASCADYDNDGWLDLFVAVPFGVNDLLYHNAGGSGIQLVRVAGVPPVSSGGVGISGTWADYDNDGDQDLYVANGGAASNPQPNFLFRNDGSGEWTRIMEGDLVTDRATSQSPIWGDYDNDGDLDLFVSNVYDRSNTLYQNGGDGTFTTITEGDHVTSIADSDGAVWADFDNDGYLDLLVGNTYNEDNHLFQNQRDGTFKEVLEGTLPWDEGSSAATAVADFDNDGDLDVYIANNGLVPVSNWSPEINFFYRNTTSGNAWIIIRLEGTASNRSGVGAKVRLRATVWGEDVWQLRQVAAGEGYYIQNDLRVHFGLGDVSRIDLLRVEWPSGIVQELENLEPNQILTVYEPPRLVGEGLGTGRVKNWMNRDFGVAVEGSSDLQNWSPVETTLDATGDAVFQDEDAEALGARFYRASWLFR